MHKRRRRNGRLAFRALEVGAVFVFFSAILHHVYTFDFKPLAALCLPILVVFFAFASLLYARGRALAKGKAQVRSLYAAERALQGAMWYLFGIILGVTIYGFLMFFDVTFDPNQPTPTGFWLLLFIPPYLLMQAGMLWFMHAIWLVSPQFFRRIDALELRRRIQQ